MIRHLRTLSFDHLLFGGVVFIVTFVLLALYDTSHTPLQASEIVTPEAAITPRDLHERLRGLRSWKRPSGPTHIALQVGHLGAAQAPDELVNIRANTGASFAGIDEVDAMARLAEITAEKLRAEGHIVTILPTTIPPNFWADVAVSLHADGSNDSRVRGFKVSHSWADHTNKGRELSRLIETHYGDVTGLPLDGTITANMRGYYAFNWRRFDHTFHPNTVGAILETGFLSHTDDRAMITQQPDLVATGIVDGITSFVEIHLAGSCAPASDLSQFACLSTHTDSGQNPTSSIL